MSHKPSLLDFVCLPWQESQIDSLLYFYGVCICGMNKGMPVFMCGRYTCVPVCMGCRRWHLMSSSISLHLMKWVRIPHWLQSSPVWPILLPHLFLPPEPCPPNPQAFIWVLQFSSLVLILAQHVLLPIDGSLQRRTESQYTPQHIVKYSS